MMAKASRGGTFEARLARLAALRRGGVCGADEEALLREALAPPGHPAVVQAAASILTEQHLHRLHRAALEALVRLADVGYQADPGCLAKAELLRLLVGADAFEGELFLRLAQHRQLEPVWGKSIDTAGRLRGLAVQGLLAMQHPEGPRAVVDLLEDPTVEARHSAIEAMTTLTPPCGELLLRHKILAGDRDEAVLLSAFEQLARMAPEDSVPFLARQTSSELTTHRQGAYLGLATTRTSPAVKILLNALETEQDPIARPALLRAIGITRSEASIGALLHLARDGGEADGCLALEALALWKGHPERVAAIRAAVFNAPSPRVRSKFEALFAD